MENNILYVQVFIQDNPVFGKQLEDGANHAVRNVDAITDKLHSDSRIIKGIPNDTGIAVSQGDNNLVFYRGNKVYGTRKLRSQCNQLG